MISNVWYKIFKLSTKIYRFLEKIKKIRAPFYRTIFFSNIE